jgi:hypothetical protein
MAVADIIFLAQAFSAVKLAMERLRKTLWEDMQKHISVMLTSCTIYPQLKIDEFLSVLDFFAKVPLPSLLLQ